MYSGEHCLSLSTFTTSLSNFHEISSSMSSNSVLFFRFEYRFMWFGYRCGSSTKALRLRLLTKQLFKQTWLFSTMSVQSEDSCIPSNGMTLVTFGIVRHLVGEIDVWVWLNPLRSAKGVKVKHSPNTVIE